MRLIAGRAYLALVQGARYLIPAPAGDSFFLTHRRRAWSSGCAVRLLRLLTNA